jgi:hypothetical protein
VSPAVRPKREKWPKFTYLVTNILFLLSCAQASLANARLERSFAIEQVRSCSTVTGRGNGGSAGADDADWFHPPYDRQSAMHLRRNLSNDLKSPGYRIFDVSLIIGPSAANVP